MTACGSGKDTAASPSAAAPAPAGTAPAPAENKLAAMVPDAIKADGKLMVGVDASYPPNESVDPSTQQIVGWDPDLIAAVATKLGLTAQLENAGFDTIIPGLQSGKYEIGASSFTDNKEREAVVDFVTYYSAGTAWATQTGNPKGVNVDDPCGKK